jgi:hypothetical protein
MIGEVLAKRENQESIDLDPHRTATHLENGVPHCYLGHPECYDRHEMERISDDVDYEDDLRKELDL